MANGQTTGSLTVNVPDFPRLGQVASWSVGQLDSWLNRKGLQGGLTQEQLDSIRGSIEGSQNALRKELAKTKTDLYDSFNKLSKAQQNYDVKAFELNRNLFGDRSRANFEIQGLELKTQYEQQLAIQKLEGELAKQNFALEKQGIDFQRGLEKLNLSNQSTLVSLNEQQGIFESQLALLETRRDTQDRQLKNQAQALRATLKAQGTILESLDRTRGLLDQREALVGRQEDLQLEQANLQRAGLTSQARSLAFQNQQQVASRRSASQLVSGAFSEILGTPDLDRASVKMISNIERTVAQTERVESEKASIVARAGERRIGIEAQREGITRNEAQVKGAIGRIKAQLKNTNLRRKQNRNETKFVSQILKTRIGAVKARRTIAGKDYKSQKAFMKASNAYNIRVANFNKDMSNRLFLIQTDNMQKSLDLGYKQYYFNYEMANRNFDVASAQNNLALRQAEQANRDAQAVARSQQRKIASAQDQLDDLAEELGVA